MILASKNKYSTMWQTFKIQKTQLSPIYKKSIFCLIRLRNNYNLEGSNFQQKPVKTSAKNEWISKVISLYSAELKTASSQLKKHRNRNPRKPIILMFQNHNSNLIKLVFITCQSKKILLHRKCFKHIFSFKSQNNFTETNTITII